MLAIRVIPCLDVKNGRVVKGTRFKNLLDSGCPLELARAYEEQGADELVFLDIVATSEERQTQIQLIEKLREVLSIPFMVGGGIRTVQDAADLLEAGADKISVNSAAVENPRILFDIANRFGSQCTVLAIDAALFPDGYRVVTRSGQTETTLEAVNWAKRGVKLGAGEILLTSIGHDGTKSGYDLRLITDISRATGVPVIASGGAGTLQDFATAIQAGASAVLAASVFHNRIFTVAEVKQFLWTRGFEVRL